MTRSRSNQKEKAERFRALHEGDSPFIVANPFDAGSARVLAGMGFQALATSSGGFAATLGRRDGCVTREEALRYAQIVARAVDLPVSADLENGFDHEPEDAARTVQLAAEGGLVGCSIEDATGEPSNPIYGIESAIARIVASARVARVTGFGFMLTARCENFLHGRADLEDVIRRLRAYEAAGADVLMAPGLPDLGAVQAVCAAGSKPVNFMVGIPHRSFSVADLAAVGVRRISLASSLYRASIAGLIAAAEEVQQLGTFTYVDRLIPTGELARFMARTTEEGEAAP